VAVAEVVELEDLVLQVADKVEETILDLLENQLLKTLVQVVDVAVAVVQEYA
jgi:hypothetical protein